MARIRFDLQGTVCAHLAGGAMPVWLRAGDEVPDGYTLDADLLAADGEQEDRPDPGVPAADRVKAVTSAPPDKGPPAGQVRTSKKRVAPGQQA